MNTIQMPNVPHPDIMLMLSELVVISCVVQFKILFSPPTLSSPQLSLHMLEVAFWCPGLCMLH